MKRILLTLALLFSFFTYAQDYLPMLEDGNRWSVDIYVDGFGSGIPPHTITKQYELIGRERINDIEYKVLNTSNSNYLCYLREENGKVFQIGYNGEEELKYDFTLEVGDVFDFGDVTGCGGNQSFPFEVIEIRTEEIFGRERKIIVFEYSFPNYGRPQEIWYEGIGSIHGVHHSEYQLDANNGSRLVCYRNNGDTFLMPNATSCDNTTLSIDEYSENDIVLYPNPVTETSILQLPENASVDKIRILDITGKLIKEEIITENYFLINAMEYASGIYFYQVFTKNRRITSEKFVVR